jgi:NAD(P)H-flavin reductase
MLSTFGTGEAPISMSGDPATSGVLVHTVRDVGPVTHSLCLSGPGSVVGLRGPYGNGWDLGAVAGRDVVVVAGGIGFAPLRPLLFELRRHRSRYGRVAVLVGARSPSDIVHRPQLERWAADGRLHVDIAVDHAQPGWHGHVGLVTDLLQHIPFDLAAAGAFVCGPEVMMRVAAGALVDAGLSPCSIQVSLERNMRCAVAHCGHCQLGPVLLCRDGPVLRFDQAAPLLSTREL